ncbi:hypothetical protein QQX98_007125 [Neonectria punicea]|uniref:Uncharacterized protein n=1 Tax=Neonectria punicea TaxID=979145 RepID=A0ABR1GYT0_9HYPO
MERPSKLADLKLVSKYYPVANYSYPDRRSHNGPSTPSTDRSSTDRTSLGSEGSAPGLVDDQADSEVSAEDDYQYHTEASELWDTFWKPAPEIKEIKETKEDELERLRKSYPALIPSPQDPKPRGPDEARHPAWPLPETHRPRFRKASATYSPFPRLAPLPPRTTSLAPSWQCSRSKPVVQRTPFPDEETIRQFMEDVTIKRPRVDAVKQDDDTAVKDSDDETVKPDDDEIKPTQAEAAAHAHDEVVEPPQVEVAKHTRDQIIKPIQFRAAENTLVEVTTPTKVEAAKRIRDEAIKPTQVDAPRRTYGKAVQSTRIEVAKHTHDRAAKHPQHAAAQHVQEKTTRRINIDLVPPPLQWKSPVTGQFATSSPADAFKQGPRPATAREHRSTPCLGIRPSTPVERPSPMGTTANHSTTSLSLPDCKPANHNVASKKSVPCLRSPLPRPNPEPQLLSVFEYSDTESESESESSGRFFFRFHKRGSSDGRRPTKTSQWGHRRRRTNASTAPTSPTVERPASKRQGSDVLGLARMLGLRSK